MTGKQDEAIAIIGMSCRFAPNIDSPAGLWSALLGDPAPVGEMPSKRWDPYLSGSPEATAILRKTTRKGFFLDDIEGFEAEFFKITPREAEYLDPQQRILLELSWEALGDAGMPPLSLGKSDTGVFVSANSNDYGRRLLEDIPRTGAWAVNGTTYYGIANRISYFLDLRGPSMAVDTACAGSLTALHTAALSLRSGETSLAIVGGINIMASPALVVALDAAGATAPDGRSKAFDRRADGYGRGEGAAVMVLKRLSDARRDKDTVHSLIVGSGVYQDGRSDGMMAPDGEAQENMLRGVYASSGIDPASVDYVEAHGTGTPLGDQAETTAMAKVFGTVRAPDRPLLFGTLKPNIGHVEAASGIAGAMKTVLALEHEKIPVSPHDEVNPDLDLDSRSLRLVDEPQEWCRGERPRRAGVSSYGVGGTISHLVLEEAPADLAADRSAIEPHDDGTPVLLPLSAESDKGLRALAKAHADWLREHPDARLTSVAHTLTRRRSHLTVRAAVVASSSEEAADLLTALAEDQRSPKAVFGRARSVDGNGPVWVFSGHGSQWSGMGRELLQEEPVFSSAIDGLADVFREEVGWTPREVIEQGGPWTVSRVQAMTFAMQIALSDVWHAQGLRPTAIIGHSVGEVAAAVVAGALDREPAARFACRRAVALEDIAGAGAMALVGLGFDEAGERVADRDGVEAAIAASTRSTVISGDAGAVEALADELRTEGVEVRSVNTDVAFHSPHVDAVLLKVAEAARELSARPPNIPLYSTALDDPRADAPREGHYWERNLRSSVRFAQGVQAALEDGARTFLEVSSHPVVAHSITECAIDSGLEDVTVAVSLRRDQPEVTTLSVNLARLFCSGSQIDWRYEGTLLPMPSVVWQHRPYWIFPDGPEESRGRGHDPDTHTLLGGLSTVASAPYQKVWQTHLDMANRPYAQDHKVVGVETVPASVVINSFAQAAAQGDRRTSGLTDIVLRTPLAATPPRVVQVVLDQNQVRMASRLRREEGVADEAEQGDEWITHATASVDRSMAVSSRSLEPVESIRARCPEEWSWKRVDEVFLNMGVEGYTFPWVVEELRRNETEQLAIVTIDHTPKLHPSSWTAVIDGALTVSGVLVTQEDSRTLRTSSHLDSIVYRGEPPGRVVVHTTRSAHSPATTIDVLVADEHGNVVCEAKGLRFTQVHDRPGSVLTPRQLVHEVVWKPLEATGERRSVNTVVLLGDSPVTSAMERTLRSRNISVTRLERPRDLLDLPEGRQGVVLVVPEPSRDGETAQSASERCAWTLVDVAQHLGRRGSGDTDPALRLWCLTRGVRDPEHESALSQAPLWGVSRIIAGERSDLWGGLVDLQNGLDPAVDESMGLLVDLLERVGPTEDVVSLTSEGAYAARLSQVERQLTEPVLECQPHGTYLITGGLGALGLATAQYLAERGARRLVLVGRRGLPPRSEWGRVEDPGIRAGIDAVLALEALGVTVRVLSLDISDAEAATAALDPSALGLPPIRGVVHAAGVVSDALVDKTDLRDLRTTFGPKVGGAMVLHRLFPPGTLDFFTMFSSCGQFARLTGQTSYAAANSFLDGLAALRSAEGHTETTSLAWTQWRGVGMGESTASTTIMEAESRGLGGISLTEAFRSWAFSDRFGLPYYAILRVMPDRSLPVFSELEDVENAEDAEGGSLAVDWSAFSPEELAPAVLGETHEQAAIELNLSVEDVEIDRPLVELGVDSVMTVGLRVRLHRRFGVDLPPTILWSNPTIRSIAELLTGELGGDAVGDPPETSTGQPVETATV
ncbi:type I polyketide synthase [Nocardiopsis alkaliphila]|uniref:type I polyketide synthase n=1 Tax=Nocardiopsis alkaliphila TaxID=225762 RepID=UPI00034A898D|nr:type I polyketide synthase [Nocardiopsis alkaliphila]